MRSLTSLVHLGLILPCSVVRASISCAGSEDLKFCNPLSDADPSVFANPYIIRPIEGTVELDMLAVGIYTQDDPSGYDISACVLTNDVSYTVLANTIELKTPLQDGYDWGFDASYAQNYEHGDTTNTLYHYTGVDEWGSDQCVNWGSYISDTSDFTGGGFTCSDMQEPVFLNSVPYMCCINAAGTESAIWMMDSAGAHTKVHTVSSGEVLDFVAFEDHGFMYTVDGVAGYTILKLNYDDFDTEESSDIYETGANWRLYQDKDEQHEHRPVWGVRSDETTNIYRLTYHATVKMQHDNSATTIAKVDLYDREYDLYP
jgi:hypothetical protein